MNSSHVHFFFFGQESWNLKPKLKVAGRHVGLSFGTALEILSKKYANGNVFDFTDFIL